MHVGSHKEFMLLRAVLAIDFTESQVYPNSLKTNKLLLDIDL